MSPPIHLQSHFAKGRRYLVAVGTQVFMAEQSAEFWPVRGRELPAIVIDLPPLWERFADTSGERVEFSKRELAKVGGCSTRMVRRWQQHGWLPDGVGPFSLAEAFTAGLIGALVRAGANEVCIAKASHFIRIGEPREAAR